MIYTDTRDSSVKADFKTAVMGGMNQATGGLYIPVEFPKLDKALLNKDPAPSFRDVAFNMAKPYVDGEIPDNDLAAIIADFYSHPERLKDYIRYGRQSVIDKYNWKVDGAKLVQLYDALN